MYKIFTFIASLVILVVVGGFLWHFRSRLSFSSISPTTSTAYAQRRVQLPAPSITNPRKNKAIDIIAYIDTAQSHAASGTWRGYPDLTRRDAERVLKLTDRLFYEKTQVHIVTRDIRFRSFDGLPPTDGWAPAYLTNALRSWAQKEITSSAPAPEAIVIFSKMGHSWQFGGFSMTSLPVGTMSSYCNEFETVGGGGQRSTVIAIVDWHHLFGSCGYGGFLRLKRISTSPMDGECRGDPIDTCVLRSDRRYYQCASLLDSPSSDQDFFTAGLIIHEIIHGFDREGIGHYGSPACGVPSEVEVGEGAFAREAALNFGMCPRTFKNIITAYNGCP